MNRLFTILSLLSILSTSALALEKGDWVVDAKAKALRRYSGAGSDETKVVLIREEAGKTGFFNIRDWRAVSYETEKQNVKTPIGEYQGLKKGDKLLMLYACDYCTDPYGDILKISQIYESGFVMGQHDDGIWDLNEQERYQAFREVSEFDGLQKDQILCAKRDLKNYSFNGARFVKAGEKVKIKRLFQNGVLEAAEGGLRGGLVTHSLVKATDLEACR
jgi:hypothetical protein